MTIEPQPIGKPHSLRWRQIRCDHLACPATHCERSARLPKPAKFVLWHVATVLLIGILSGLGCQRTMHFSQDYLINNAMNQSRADRDKWESQPLEVDIVCVNASDLKDERNDRLAPGSSITCKEWYESRPIGHDDEDDASGTFNLPKSRIFMLTHDMKKFGTRRRGRLRGKKLEPADVSISFSFPGGLHDEKKSVIWVFPKFLDPNGEVLPVPPAAFDPPGAYTKELHVKIGVDLERPHFGQFIENTTPRELHGRGGQR